MAVLYSWRREKRLDGAYVLCLPALGALDDVELDALAFLKAAEALCLDGGVMDEYVLAVFTAQKAEALCVVKPLNGALFHDEISFFRVTYRERNVEVIASVERLLGTGKNFKIEFYDLE